MSDTTALTPAAPSAETPATTPRPITLALLALGGQGGGVLADWIVDLATDNGYFVQSTSVPGVAQRTGATVYYLELFPEAAAPESREPVLAMMPVPGDVDVVIASELMEGGRAVLRGLVSPARTLLITSTHRVYAVSEKAAMGNGLGNADKIIEAAAKKARQLVAFDMEAATDRSGSVISSVMFGALAGSGALPFPREAFEHAIRKAGVAVASNLKGFAAGFTEAQTACVPQPATPDETPAQPSSAAGRRLYDRVMAELPAPARYFAVEGVRKLMDYQDAAYADLYLDRLKAVAALDSAEQDWALTRETARGLALWMAYEDTIRVADLKTRDSRFARVRQEVKAAADQIIDVTEFMHPRLVEVCETLPAAWGRRILNSPSLVNWLEPYFRAGRHVTTSRTGWFVMLWLLGRLRRFRRATLRYELEQGRITAWLDLIATHAPRDPALALEIARCQRLVKGYSDTHERGLRNFGLVLGVLDRLAGHAGAAGIVARLREAALADEDGRALADALATLEQAGALAA